MPPFWTRDTSLENVRDFVGLQGVRRDASTVEADNDEVVAGP
jgi:hypothetical protein